MPTEHGDAEIARAGEILRCTVGSELFGVALPDANSDHDEMAIYIPTMEQVLGFLPYRDDYVWRTAGEGQRSGDGDTDSISYSLKKYLSLAVKGNPTILLPLFAPDDKILHCTDAGRELRAMRSHFLSVHAVHRFLGYLSGQVQRIRGQTKKHVPNRPELIEKHGWDTKYGSHALRLGYQGLEIAVTGHLTLPMPPAEREHVLWVKQGKYTQDECLADVELLVDKIQGILDRGEAAVPPEPNTQLITEWAVETQLNFWGQ
jgi:hypothetical protein